MNVQIVETSPFSDQRPGTSGLRKKTQVFMEPHYLENFIQAVFDSLREDAGGKFSDKTLVIGGDGRYYNRTAIQRIIRMAVANGFGRVFVGRHGILSTPAVSAIVRAEKAFGGFVLSASHNPGGVDGDFGIKYNISNGGPSPAKVTERIFEVSKRIGSYRIISHEDIDLDNLETHHIGDTEVRIIDSLWHYTQLMERLFDFDVLRKLFQSGFRMCFDAMHAATGPYAHYIFENCLGAPDGTVMRGNPLVDFGGEHPDPNQVHARELMEIMERADAPDLGAASDGDGDRNMILGRNFFVTPGDSLSVITQYASACIPGYRSGIRGVARSMPTSMAVDRVAAELGVPCYETPTGWKYFGNLMDAELCTICGEESFGTGSSHVREKDGLWAVLCWMSVIAHTGSSVRDIVQDHWARYGRSYFQRHDYEGLNAEQAGAMLSEVRDKLGSLKGMSFAGRKVLQADDFGYTDPVDGSIAVNQGIRIFLDNNSRIVFRLSGTGTEGATLRIYLESYLDDGGKEKVEEILAPLSKAVMDYLKLQERFEVEEPSVIT